MFLQTRPAGNNKGKFGKTARGLVIDWCTGGSACLLGRACFCPTDARLIQGKVHCTTIPLLREPV